MWRVFIRYTAFRRLGAVLIEHVTLVLCVMGAMYIRLHPYLDFPEDYRPLLLRAMAVALVFQLSLYFKDVYTFRSSRSMSQFLFHLAQALVLASAVLGLIYFFFQNEQLIGRGVYLVSIILVSSLLTLWHVLLRIYHGIRPPRTNLLVLGTGRLARELVTEILRRPELSIRVSGFIDDNPAIVGTSVVNPKVLGVYEDLPQIVAAKKVDRIVVGLQDRRGRLPISQLLNLKIQGVAIEDATSLYERISGKIAIENLKPSWMIFNSGFEVSKKMLVQKRILSLVVSLFLLLLFSPIFLLVMILIKLDSPGSVFHKQERVGKDGDVFTLWKFRSMHADAEKETGPVWAAPDDSRVTRVGKLLRRSRLDELPQLFNVLRGDMSLVGPRPERPHFVEQLTKGIPFYNLRHKVKPGVTGWAQINYKYGNTMRDAVEKLQYDLFYIKHMSWLLDFLIILQTIKIVLMRKGS